MEEGYSVRVATSGEEGSELLARGTPPAMVVLDVHLPGYSGLHLLSQFRRQNAVTPVLVLSDGDRASLRAEALSTGANGFVQKPLSPTLLLEAVRRLLEDAVLRAG
jgi:DNA-binding response OmpR family regulator